MGINDLPKPGINFRATAGAGNFKRKLSGATRYGELKNLRNNQAAIVEAVRKYQGVIRTKGGLSRLQQRDAWLKVKASDKTVTKEDMREIKHVFSHLGRSAAASVKKPAIKPAGIKASDGKSYLTEAQIRRNVKRAQWDRLDNAGTGQRGIYTRQYAGGKQVKSYGVFGAAEETDDKKNKTGFAADYQKNKLPADKPPEAPPSAGIKPLDL